MAIDRKKFRYTYWLIEAFVKKNIQPIILSFLLAIIGVITIVSFSPYLVKLLTTKEQIIGIAGTYTIDNLPDPVLSKISNGLLYINEKGEVIPLLAESWEQVSNGTEYRFHLNKDLQWNDNQPFTAKDINYVFKDVKTETQGDHLIIFKLKKRLSTFPNFLTRPIIKQPLVGVAGVYKVEKARIKSGFVKEMQLTPNKPDLPIIIYKFYDTETKLISAYKLGEITEISTNKETIANLFADWKNTEITKTVDYSKVVTLFFNMNNPLFKDDKDIRHAIATAINKEHFVNLGEEAHGPLPPTSWGYSNVTKKISYNPAQAIKILKKYTEGTESAALTLSTYYDDLALADEIKTDIENTGLGAKVEVLASNQPVNFDLFLAQMQLTQDPDQYFFWHSLQKQGNITGYKNVRIDKILEDGRDTFDLGARKKIYADFQRILTDEMPAHFLYHPYIYTIKRK